jgi:hypothetical protein
MQKLETGLTETHGKKKLKSLKLSAIVAFIYTAVAEAVQSTLAQFYGAAYSTFTVGRNTYVVLTGPAAFILDRMAKLKDMSAIVIFAPAKYADVARIVYLKQGDASVILPTDLKEMLLANGCYAPIRELAASTTGQRFNVDGDKSLSAQYVKEFLAATALIMFERDGQLKGATPGVRVNKFLTLENEDTTLRVIGSWERFGGLETYVTGTVNTTGVAVRHEIVGDRLYQVDCKSGKLQAIELIALVQAFANGTPIAWQNVGSFGNEVQDIAAVRQHGGGLAIIATMAQGSEHYLVPMTITTKGERITGTLNLAMATKWDDNAPGIGGFVGFRGGENDKAVFVDHQNGKALKIVPTKDVPGLGKFGPWIDAAPTTTSASAQQANA